MKIGFIGSGPISKFHILALQKNSFKIEAIGSRKNSENCIKLSREFNLEEKFCPNGWQEVLEKEVEAFCICTKVDINFTILQKALKKNLPIFIEKPVVWDKELISKLIALPNSENVFVGYNRLYYETVQKAKFFCKEFIGGTILVNIPDSIAGRKQFIENGCHLINILQFLIGDFKVAKTLLRENHKFKDLESVSAICQNKDWKILINAHSQIPANFSITINSGKKVLELKPIEKLSVFEGINIIEPTPESPIRKYQPALSFEIFENTKLKPGFEKMYKSFKEFIGKSKNSNLCDLKKARTTLEICYELLENKKLF